MCPGSLEATSLRAKVKAVDSRRFEYRWIGAHASCAAWLAEDAKNRMEDFVWGSFIPLRYALEFSDSVYILFMIIPVYIILMEYDDSV